MIHYNEKNANPSPFSVGDKVLIHREAFCKRNIVTDLNKFDDRWYGPYSITRIINVNAYDIELPMVFKAHNIINITFLRLLWSWSIKPKIILYYLRTLIVRLEAAA